MKAAKPTDTRPSPGSTTSPPASEDRHGDPATVDALRHEIDRGATGDKVAFSDPAAAPLGTDDEAAGTPAGPERLKMAADAETRRARGQERIERPEDLQPGRSQRSWVWTGLALVLVVLIVIFVAASTLLPA